MSNILSSLLMGRTKQNGKEARLTSKVLDVLLIVTKTSKRIKHLEKKYYGVIRIVGRAVQYRKQMRM